MGGGGGWSWRGGGKGAEGCCGGLWIGCGGAPREAVMEVVTVVVKGLVVKVCGGGRGGNGGTVERYSVLEWRAHSQLGLSLHTDL